MRIMKVGAVWCPECAIMRPRWEAVKKRFPGLAIEEVDLDRNPEIKERYKIDHVPTAIFLDQEKELSRFPGLLETGEIVEEIKRHI